MLSASPESFNGLPTVKGENLVCLHASNSDLAGGTPWSIGRLVNSHKSSVPRTTRQSAFSFLPESSRSIMPADHLAAFACWLGLHKSKSIAPTSHDMGNLNPPPLPQTQG